MQPGHEEEKMAVGKTAQLMDGGRTDGRAEERTHGRTTDRPTDGRTDGPTGRPTDWLTFFLLISPIFDRPDKVDRIKTQVVCIERLTHGNFHVSKTSFTTDAWKEIFSEIEKAEF